MSRGHRRAWNNPRGRTSRWPWLTRFKPSRLQRDRSPPPSRWPPSPWVTCEPAEPSTVVGGWVGMRTISRCSSSWRISPWDPALVVKATAERVAPAIDVEAWVLDDTGFPKDGKHSPGVKRQYSGTLGKIGNCQIGVSVHAVGMKGTVPLGWALYLPEEWCKDTARRQKAKIPAEVEFRDQAAARGGSGGARRRLEGRARRRCSAISAYGDNTELRDRLHDGGPSVRAVGLARDDRVHQRDAVHSARAALRAGPPQPPPSPRPDPESIGR